MTQEYFTVAQAAERLGMSPWTLYKRLAVGARKVGKEVRTELGDGIVAVQFGRLWRIRFPSHAA
jgi:hypothetical protein